MTNVEVLKNEVGLYEDVKSYVVENDLSDIDNVDDYINNMSRKELLNAYLCWNGIFGYTSDIVMLVAAMLNPQYKDIYEMDFDDYNCKGDYVWDN